jgi:hypothetical protein
MALNDKYTNWQELYPPGRELTRFATSPNYHGNDQGRRYYGQDQFYGSQHDNNRSCPNNNVDLICNAATTSTIVTSLAQSSHLRLTTPSTDNIWEATKGPAIKAEANHRPAKVTDFDDDDTDEVMQDEP